MNRAIMVLAPGIMTAVGVAMISGVCLTVMTNGRFRISFVPSWQSAVKQCRHLNEDGGAGVCMRGDVCTWVSPLLSAENNCQNHVCISWRVLACTAR